MTKIYLIRHAEAEGNRYRRMQGHYDGGITPRGYVQIEALAERFRDVPIDALYSSDLKRTMTTAGAVLKHHELTLNTDARLREVNVGIWENMPFGNIFHDEPQQMYNFSYDPDKWYIEGGEGFPHVQKRIYEAITELGDKHDGQTIALFSHGMAIRSLICKLLGVPSERASEVGHGDNTCVSLFEFENGELRMDYYNDNSHLSQDTSTFARQSWWREKKGKVDIANLRFLPMDLEADGQLYKDCYADSWQNAHGSLAGFCGNTYLKNAMGVSKIDPRCVMKCFAGATDFAGIVELDPVRAENEGAGWISFFYILPQFRGEGFAPQLLGHAVSFFREKGRKKLRLHVTTENQRAVKFYENEGFVKIGIDEGAFGELILMEMPI